MMRALTEERLPGRVWPARVARVAGVCASLAALLTAVAHANVLVSLLLLGLAYLLGGVAVEVTALPPWKYLRPLTLFFIIAAALYVVVADFVLVSSSN